MIVDTNTTRHETPQVKKSYTCSLRVHLLHIISIMSFKLGYVSIPKRRIFSPLFLFCAYDRILRFSHIYCQLFSRVPFVDGSDVPLNSECINFNDRVRKAPNNYYFGAIFWNHGQEKKKLPVDRYISFSHRLLMITTNLIKYFTM
jgi:hypothetical protein